MPDRAVPDSLTLETERCILRKFAYSDIPFIFSASQHPGFCNGMRWYPPESLEELIEPCQANQKAWETGTGFTFTILEKSSRHSIGRIAIRHETDDVWNLGFWTHPDFQSRGFMTEAAARLLEWGFTTLHADRILAAHASWNIASRRVLEKIGMQFLRHLPEGFEKNGAWVAEDVLELRSSVWKQGTQ